MVNVITSLITGRNRPRGKMDARYITIHDTGNSRTGADAEAHSKYLQSTRARIRNVSWHFTVDDKEIYQHLPLDEHGWHAGDGRNGPGNRKSIGIEICQNRDGDRRLAELHAAWLVNELLEKEEIFTGNVKQHYNWSGKNCPGILRQGRGWQNFLELVAGFSENVKNVIVERGDTLFSLSRLYGVTVTDILRYNPQVVNPNLIRVGQILRFPKN